MKASLRLTLLPLLLSSLAAQTGYLGSAVCAGCHKDIAKTQLQTNMANTWQGIATRQLPADYSETHAEGPDPFIHYAVQRNGDKAKYQIQMPGQPPLEYPVESIIGGKRHGVTFLFRIPELQGSPLPRAPLMEGRYIHSVLENGLALELGFPEDKPSNYETAFGRVLTPSLKSVASAVTSPRAPGEPAQNPV